MRGGSSRAVAGHLRTLYQAGVLGPLGDEELLERFLARRDEAGEEAFAELVRRHGPMVLGACRRVLRDAHEAEDVFQATFLVLARKAAAVMRGESVASWLHCVAVRTAKEALLRAARRRAREERVSAPIRVYPPDDRLPNELRDILDEELARLPARHRGPVVLCELEGLSRSEAARRLGIPEGTLSSRLARARAQLRDRLAARGVALPAAAIASVLAREARAAAVPLSLLESTVEAAAGVAAGPIAAAGLSAPVASLCEGVIQTMLVAKIKGIVLAVGAVAAVVSGAVVLAQSGQPGPNTNNQAVATKGRTGSDPDGQAAGLEKKLDRVLEALERLAPKERSTSPVSDDDVAIKEARKWIVEKLNQTLSGGHGDLSVNTANGLLQLAGPRQASGALCFSCHSQPHAGLPIVAQRPASPPPPTQEGLQATMQKVQQRLERLEEQVKSLDARIGGGRGR
jgi:RNA polymerase sigma factor (sigma-70 family)